ncbi:unnamed protein product, partial [Porites lobata]
ALWLFGAFCPREWLKNFTFNTVELSKSAVLAAEQPEEITEAIELMRSLEGPVLLEIK